MNLKIIMLKEVRPKKKKKEKKNMLSVSIYKILENANESMQIESRQLVA